MYSVLVLVPPLARWHTLKKCRVVKCGSHKLINWRIVVYQMNWSLPEHQICYIQCVPLNTRREGLFSHVDGSYFTIVTYRGIVVSCTYGSNFYLRHLIKYVGSIPCVYTWSFNLNFHPPLSFSLLLPHFSRSVHSLAICGSSWSFLSTPWKLSVGLTRASTNGKIEKTTD